MNTIELYPEYSKLRKAGYPANAAARLARTPPAPALKWNGENLEVTRGNLLIRLSMTFDEWPDISPVGKYSDKYAPGAIDRRLRRDQRHNEYRYFIPAYSLKEEIAAYHQSGCSKHLAYTKAMQNIERTYKRIEDYNQNGWSMVIMTATAYTRDKTSHNLYECASTSIGGIESDNQSYIDEMALNLIDEVISQAKANKNRLIKTKAAEIAALADV